MTKINQKPVHSDLEGNDINYIHEKAFVVFTQLEDLLVYI